MTLNFFFLIYHKSNNAGFSRNLDSQHNILNMLNICEACKICHWFMVCCLCCCVVDMCLLFILLQVCQIFCREMLTSHLKRTFLSPAFVIKPFFFSHLFSMIEHALFQVFTGASISGPKQIFASETEVLGRGGINVCENQDIIFLISKTINWMRKCCKGLIIIIKMHDLYSTL